MVTGQGLLRVEGRRARTRSTGDVRPRPVSASDTRLSADVRHPGRATDWPRRSCGDVDPGVTRRRRHRGRGGVRRVLAMRKRRCGLDLIWSRVAGWLVTVGASRALPRRPRTDSTSGTEHTQLPHCRGTSVVPGFARLESYLVKAMWGRFPPSRCQLESTQCVWRPRRGAGLQLHRTLADTGSRLSDADVHVSLSQRIQGSFNFCLACVGGGPTDYC